MISLTVDGLTFTSDTNSGWGLSDIDGWLPGPPIKTQSRDRPQADGNFGIAKFYRSARALTVTGLLTAETEPIATAMRYSVAALQSDGLPSSFVVDENGFVLSMIAELVGSPDISLITETVYSYVLQFQADDSRKYAPELVTITGLGTSGTGLIFPITYPVDFGTPGDPGRLVTTNSGTADTYSLFEVTGGLSGGFQLLCIETGQVIRFERTIPVGSVVTVNPSTGRASIDGQSDVSGFLTRQEWWFIPPGVTRTIQFSALGSVTGTPTLTARTRPAYW